MLSFIFVIVIVTVLTGYFPKSKLNIKYFIYLFLPIKSARHGEFEYIIIF